MGCLQNKYKPNGDVERYKARLVAKGCTQMEGVDFHETFAPVAKLVTVRTLLTVAVKRNWHIHQLDVNNAFLHGDLNEDVYMKLPEGFGIEVAKTKEGMVLSQRKYTLDILEDVGMTGSTRPDITYAVNILSQFVSDPRQPHMDAANRVLCYLKGTPGQGILIPRDGETNLLAYCDSDWLGCPMTRRSEQLTTFYLGGLLVSGRPKKQSVVSKSSAEAEYRAMSNALARHIANNPVFHERTKHVEMDCYFVRERVDSMEICPMPIATKEQSQTSYESLRRANSLSFFYCTRSKLGARNLHAPT
ncbi:integrase [Tanacetum coccineum]|uniref:Integrase n=1 Tax=Tanacetum coccineum TaxID=301880 RepID=A0ABQ5H3R7_9ASTR